GMRLRQVREQRLEVVAGAGHAGLGYTLPVFVRIEPTGTHVFVESLDRGISFLIADAESGRGAHEHYGAPSGGSRASAICKPSATLLSGVSQSSSPDSLASRSACRARRASIRCSICAANACRGLASSTYESGSDKASAMIAPRNPVTPSSHSNPN